LEAGEIFWSVADDDCSGDGRWVVGSLFEPDGETNAGVIITDYAVLVKGYWMQSKSTKAKRVACNLYWRICCWI
jgi:hypothetical protein